jgi:hypothetical protein
MKKEMDRCKVSQKEKLTKFTRIFRRDGHDHPKSKGLILSRSQFEFIEMKLREEKEQR